MKPRFLLDENLNPAIKAGLQRVEPNIDVVYVGESRMPSKGTLDPDILVWIEANGYILVTDNRKTMPTHMSDHIAQNRSFPGIFLIKAGTSMGDLIDFLHMVWHASEAEEHYNIMDFIPW
jgi:hypothetical protein